MHRQMKLPEMVIFMKLSVFSVLDPFISPFSSDKLIMIDGSV